MSEERGLSGQIARLQMSIYDLSHRLEHYAKTMEQLVNAAAVRSAGIDEETSSEMTLPLRSMEDFQSLEMDMKNGRKKSFIKYMRRVGGADIGQCVNNIFRRLMIDELAMQFSYTGRTSNGNTKTPFHGSEISKCILIAVQTLFGEIATEVKYGLLASKWLQQARTRVLRRTKSRETDEAQIEDNNI
ncbi:uncharacterized protein LOC120348931 isoform X1 [Nilaparvata lugens]|uniref:uncharacterized protein LOC120348931 isoform X1 n=2 Tax=Nilaparvata lugens TaxID=108931 RepID=UPI00193CFD5C|nr:uncharacterized protein LOC120348931 isoform X1 [Nilaparvata lugens]